MRRSLIIIATLTFALALIMPVASANWKFRGVNEPDTLMDSQDGYMFLHPDDSTDDKHRVYFSAFAATPVVGYVPFGVGTLGTRIQPAPEMQFTALMGIWKDCNGDGYIGQVEGALIEYRAELLDDSSICPVGNLPPAGTAGKFSLYPHNDGTWIREFLFIGPKWTSVNPTTIYAPGSAVWHDWNLPGEAPRTTCPTTGNIGVRNVGSMLDWADCFIGYRTTTTLNDIDSGTGLPVGGWDQTDLVNSTGPLNVGTPGYTVLYGENADERGGLLAREDPNEGHNPPQAYEVFDCSSGAPSGSTDVNPTGSYYETANETHNMARFGECHRDGDDGLAYPGIEGQSDSTNAFRGRDAVDTLFVFNTGNRNAPVVGGRGSALGPYAPHDLGVGADRDLDTVGPSWRTNTIWGQDAQLISRQTLGPAPASYMTFYGHVGESVVSLDFPSANPGTYGAEACGGAEDGVHNGWNCASEAWDYQCIVDTRAAVSCIQPGWTYQLRDIDCWDGTVVRGAPRASSTEIAGQVCAADPDYETPLN